MKYEMFWKLQVDLDGTFVIFNATSCNSVQNKHLAFYLKFV